MIGRRQFLIGAVGTARFAAGRQEKASGLRLGFSLYGMKSLKTEEAIQAVRAAGYDSVEICLLPGWDAEASRLAAERRRAVRELLKSAGLVLGALMEQVDLGGDAAKQRDAIERLKRAAGLGHELSPDAPPIVETTMGGGKWDEVRETFRDRLGGWAEAADRAKTIVAVKPHRFGAVNRPEDAVWLVEQVKSRWIRLAYDYSHFAHREMPLAATVAAMIPHTSFIHVKDAAIRDGKAVFLLPGEAGDLDYAELLQQVHAAGYRGEICVEVSGMVSGKPGYDSIAAAKQSYRVLSAAFDKAGLRRPSR